ncbi:hypothetical protein CDL15_Pgr006497 [Punica granatum]|uniref:NFXL1 RRM-like domain-containing protein n=1 Tax=Punica granatum TaxID=22663 RepID=A0A218XZV6_PUNGR|nr:hypothetical protein CDL15_Pgr006497 [Punica granatum]
MAVEERCKFLVLRKGRTGSNGLEVHVFCLMLKEKRDAVKLIAGRWKLAVNSASWEPEQIVVVHVTSKSKPPSRVLGLKTVNSPHPPVFDPLVDMDSRLVVSFFDLPRESDVSGLVLRFGGECELVWLNDKNALAVFGDPARAATALRRLDQGSVYYGVAVVVVQNEPPSALGANVSEGASVSLSSKGNPWKKAMIHEAGWKKRR